MQVDSKRQYWNSYSYVGNNPISRIDPDGQSDIDFDLLNAPRKYPIQAERMIQFVRMAESFGKRSQAYLNYAYSVTPQENWGRIEANLTSGHGALIAFHDLSGAYGIYDSKTQHITPRPIYISSLGSLSLMVSRTVTVLHESIHWNRNDQNGIIYSAELMLREYLNELRCRTDSAFDSGDGMEVEVFGFDVNPGTAEYMINNREKYGSLSQFAEFYRLVDFVSKETGIDPHTYIETVIESE